MEELLKGPYVEGQTTWWGDSGADIKKLLRRRLHFLGSSLPYSDDYLLHEPSRQSTTLKGKSGTRQDKKKSGVAAPLWMY